VTDGALTWNWRPPKRTPIGFKSSRPQGGDGQRRQIREVRLNAMTHGQDFRAIKDATLSSEPDQSREAENYADGGRPK
jgi:hypothetical protein